jgi:hypothetical protein
VAVTGLHRKHAIRLLSAENAERRPRGRTRVRYGREVTEALVLFWEASDRVCSKRLKAMIPTLLPALERHGQLAPDAELRAALLSVSPATIDRLLSEIRIAAAQGRRRRAGFSFAVRRSVPVRTFSDWGVSRRASLRWPSVSFSRISRPSASTSAWILVVSSLRERPMQRDRRSFFDRWRRADAPDRRGSITWISTS